MIPVGQIRNISVLDIRPDTVPIGDSKPNIRLWKSPDIWPNVRPNIRPILCGQVVKNRG